MLRMDQVHVIRHKVLIEGQSIMRVAREMGLSRLTVRKYLESSEPVRRRYRSRARPVWEQVRARPVWEQVRARLEELVAQWEPRTTAKQRLTARAVFPHAAFTKMPAMKVQAKGLTEPDLPAHTRRTAALQATSSSPHSASVCTDATGCGV